MQVNDFKNIQEAIKYEVLQDEKEYLKLLKVIGNNQKYDFSSQLSIYNKEPEARACAIFDIWKQVENFFLPSWLLWHSRSQHLYHKM